MLTKELIDGIEYEFTQRINRKTGWEKNEVMVEFHKAIVDATTKLILLSEHREVMDGNQSTDS